MSMRPPCTRRVGDRGARNLTPATGRGTDAGTLRQQDAACLQPPQRQDWYPEKRRWKQPNERPQRPMVPPSFPQARETQQGRWRHGRDRSRGEQEERQQLPGEAEDEMVRHRWYGQQLLQQGSEHFVRKQQQRQSHEGTALRQNYSPTCGAARWSGAANEAPSMPHAGDTTLGDSAFCIKVELHHKSGHGRREARSSQSKESTKKDTEIRSSAANTEGSSGDLEVSNFAESSSSTRHAARAKTEVGNSGRENDSSCRHNKRPNEEYSGCNIVTPGSNWRDIGARRSGEDGIVRQAESCTGQQHANAHERREAISTDGNGSARQLLNSSAPWSCYGAGSERPGAGGLAFGSSLLELEGTAVSTSARIASPPASAQPPLATAPAILEKMERTVIGEQLRTERSWPAENAKAEGVVAAAGAPAAAFSRATPAADLVGTGSSCGTSTSKKQHFPGGAVVVADDAPASEKSAPQFTAEGPTEGRCAANEEKKHFLKSTSARAADDHSSSRRCSATPPPAAPEIPLGTAGRWSAVRAQTRVSSSAATTAQSATTPGTGDAAGIPVSGRVPSANAVRLCSCGCCSYCSRNVDEAVGATKAKWINTGASAAFADLGAEGEKNTRSQDATGGVLAAVEALKGEEKNTEGLATQEGELRAHLRRVEALNEVLLTNISSLYKTAKAELDRKDAAIAEKDREIAALRLKLQECVRGGPHQQQRLASTSQEMRQKHHQQTWQWQQQQQQPKTLDEQLYTRQHHQPRFQPPQLLQQRYSHDQLQTAKHFQQPPNRRTQASGEQRRGPTESNSCEPGCRYSS